MEIEEVIYDFLNEFGYTEDERIEGVIFYGSYQTNTNKEDSDVDLIIIYNSNSQKQHKKNIYNIKDIILKIIKERYKIYMIE